MHKDLVTAPAIPEHCTGTKLYSKVHVPMAILLPKSWFRYLIASLVPRLNITALKNLAGKYRIYR